MREPIPKDVQLQIWNRNGWACRYCGEPVFFAPTLKLFHQLSPGHGYYHPNGKEGEILPLFQWRWASVDHINPVTKGGANSEDNYVTACWECNLKLSNKTSAEGKSKPLTTSQQMKKLNWDGLSSLYLRLSEKNDEWCSLIKARINDL